MAKVKTNPLSGTELTRIIEAETDFPFEMAVLSRLGTLGFQCEHAGTYVDPVSEKIRQFDIRAHIALTPEAHLHLAVECKNIGPHYPLVVSRVPRRDAEAFHHLLRYFPVPRGFPGTTAIELATIRHPGSNERDARYPVGAPVGKRFDQAGVALDGSPQADDGQVFSKMSQALSSCKDLIAAAALRRERGIHATLPILVLPDKVLWAIDYDDRGVATGPAYEVANATLYLGQAWPVNVGIAPPFILSHLEIQTLSYLADQFLPSVHPSGPQLFPVNWKPDWA